jgi:type II secretory pathway pseudopilin PulG
MVRIYFLKNNSLTLLEILIVTIIIGILSALGFVNYSNIKEDAIDKEARSNLKLIQAGERIYRMETANYVALDNTAEINSKLKLSLPTSDSNWDYKVDSVTVSPAAFTARARRTSGTERTWCINQTTDEPWKGCSW